MPYVRTFTFTPSPRSGTPWTAARIAEAADAGGPWVTLTTVTLTPADTDPTDPQERLLTTEAATLEAGWYRITWVDSTGDTQNTEPIAWSDPFRDRLARMVDAYTEPALTGEDLADLLTGARVADADGAVPSDAAWAATYDLNAAAAVGWERKAGRAAFMFDITVDGHSFRRDQVQEHCLAMAALHRAASSFGRGSVRVDSIVSPEPL